MIRKSTYLVLTCLTIFFTGTIHSQTLGSNPLNINSNKPIKIQGFIGRPENPPTGEMISSLSKEELLSECQFFSQDSLAGFNLESLFNYAKTSNIKLVDEFKALAFYKERDFVKNKYHITDGNASAKKYNDYTPEAAACSNLDFELGNFSSWTGTSGDNQNSNNPLTILGAATFSTNQDIYSCNFIQSITSAYGNDPIGFPGLDPSGGNYSARLGGFYINQSGSYGATGVGGNCASGNFWSTSYSNGERLAQSFAVTAANCLISFDYAVVLNDGGHANGEQPYFHVYITNSSGTVLSTCTQYYVQAAAGGPPAGFTNSGYVNSGDNSSLYYKSWTSNSINLTPYIGQNVNVYFIAAGCIYGQHMSWAYIDATCGPADIDASAVNPCPGTNMTLTAPPVIGSYSWSGPSIVGGTTGQSVTISGPGTYSVTITPSQGAGCAYTLTYTATYASAPVLSPTASPAGICSGNSSTLSVSGASTYTWSTGSNASSISVSPGSTTTYTVSGTNASGCVGTKTVSVTVSTTPTVSITGNMSICSGQSTTLTGGTANTYSWNVGSTSATIGVSPTSTTSYTLVGTNGGVCSATAVATVTVTPTPTLSVAGGSICSSQSIVLTNTGAGSGSNTYTWSPTGGNANSATVTPTSNTTYTLTAANGACTKTTTATVTVTATPTVSVAGGTVCSGQTVVLTNTGPAAASYTWSPSGGNATTATVSPTSNTTYTLTAANGACTASTTATVTVTSTPTLAVTGGSICSGQSIVLTNTGSVAGGYTWSPTGGSASSATVSPTSNTTYTLTGANGACSASTTAAVTVTATPTLAVANGSICSGQSIVLTNTGPAAASYTWSPTGGSANSATVSPTSNTTYTLTAANGACTKTTTATVTVTPTPTVAVAGGSICSTQSFTLSDTGPAAGSYTWAPTGGNASSATVSPTTNTTYTLTAANGACTASTTAIVTVTPTPTVSITGNVNICSGVSTVLTGNGATTYSWSPGGATTTTITVTPPIGSTSYTLQGFNGVCTASTVATISVTPTPTVSISGNNDLCSGQTETLTASGATAPNYTWTPGGTGTTISITPGTTTNYTLTGANGTCTASAIASVSVTATPTVGVTGNMVICSGASTVLTATTASTYSWSTGGITTNTISVSPTASSTPTTTSYTVTGANGTCTASAVATVTVNPLPAITGSVVTAAPCGNPTGCINSVTVSGGAPTYSYSWNGGSTYSSSSTNCGIAANTYPVQVIDANGCTTSGSIYVPSLSGPAAPAAAPSSNAVCLGDSAVFTVSPTTNGITYTWTDVTGGGTHVGSYYTVHNINPPGTYSVSVQGTDINGCNSSPTTLTITVNTLPNTAVAGTAHFCKGSGTPLTASPNSGPYSYQWTMGGTNIAGATSATYSATAGGNYGVIITNTTTGCYAASVGNYAVTVDSLPKIDTSSMVITNSNCGAQTGSILNVTVTPSAGSTYNWHAAGSSVVISTSPDLNNAGAGNYCLVVTTDPSTNCKDSLCGMQINNAGAPPTPTLTTTNNTYCAGQTQSAITVGGSGTFSWYSDAALSTQIASGPTYTPTVAVTTTFYVTATNSGCQSASLPVTVTINPNPTAPVVSNGSSNPLIECQNSTPGSVTVTPTGTVVSTPVWYSGGMTVATGTVFTPSTANAGTTIYTVVDSANATGCKDTSAGNVITVTVTINPLPTGPTIGLTPSTLTECQGTTPQSLTVTPTGTVTSIPVWYSGGATVGTGPVYTPPNNTPGIFVYTVADSSAIPNGCVNLSAGSTVSFTVTVNPMPTGPTLTTAGDTLKGECAAPSPAVTLTVTSTGSVPSVPVWYNSSGGYITSGNTYSPPNNIPGTYVYTVADSAAMPNGCVNLSAGNVITITVTVNSNPSITGTPTINPSNCGSPSGGVIGLTPSGNPNFTYQWIDSTGAVVGTSIDLANSTNGHYTLIVTDGNGCTNAGSPATYTVPGSAAIAASFTASPTTGQAPLPVTFANGSTGATGYNWSFGTGPGDTTSITNPSFTYANAGTYTVMLIAHGPNGGCPDTAFATIVVDQATSIVIPNVFSPNGDQINDEFIIMCTGMDKLHCDIFNRWGQLVFTLTAPNQSWDGKLNNGNMATEGTYYYMLNATGFDKKTYTYQGPLTLVK